MKLHLPSGLRKALMACLAAVALPATLPSTLASVSGIAAMMFLFTSQRATAQALTWSSGNSYTIQDGDSSVTYDSLTLTGETGVVTILFQTVDNTLTIGGRVSSGQTGVDLRLCDDDNHNKGTVVFQGGGEIKGTLVLFDNATVKIGTELSVGALGGNGFNIQTTGDQDVTLNITGGATGSNSKDALGQNQSSTIGEHVVLKIGPGVTQKISGVRISGTVDLNGANAVLSSTNVDWGCNEDTMSGKLTGNGTLQVAGETVQYGGLGASHTLHWSGDSSSFSGKLEVKTGGILDMSTSMHAGSLTLSDQSEIKITAGTLRVGEITLNGNDASITIAKNETARIDFSVITGGRLTINLTGFTESGTSRLFGSQFNSWFSTHQNDWNNYIVFSGVGVGQKVTLSTDQTGSIVISDIQTHVFSGESLTWQDGKDGWASGGVWVNGDSAEFSAGAGEHAVTLGDNVDVASFRVTTAGATYNFTGTGTLTIGEYANAGSSGSPEVATTMTFGEGVNVHVTGNFTNHGAKSAYTFKEKLVVDGILSLWGSPNSEVGASVMTLEKGAEVGELEASWAGKFVLGGDLVVKSWTFDGSNGGGHFTWFEKMEGADGDVYVDVQTSMTLRPSGGNGTLSFGADDAGKGVGLKVSGSGNTLEMAAADWNIGGNLAAADGGNLTLNPGAYTIGGSLLIGTGSTVHGLQGVTIRSSVTLSDGATLKFGAGDGSTQESIIEGTVTDGNGYGTLILINADATLSDDVVLKGTLQFGWGHTGAETSYIKLKKKIEAGSLLLDYDNHNMHFKKADDAEGDVYVILNLSEVEGHASQLGNSNSPIQINNSVLTYSDNQFLSLFEEGVVFGVKGDGKKLTLGGGGETKGGLFVDAGATLQFGGTGVTWTIKGAISGEGQLNVYNSPVILEKGGSIGRLLAGWNEASIALGGDLEIGGWGWDNNNTAFRFKKKEEAEGSPVVIFKKDEGVDFLCGNNLSAALQDGGDISTYVGWLTTGENDEDKIGNGVGLGKSGTGKLRVGNRADVTIYGDVVVLGGELQMGDDCGVLVHGKLRGEAGTTLTIQTGTGTTAEEDAHCLEIKGGGDYDGLLSMSRWGGQLKIGDDLTVGGMTEDAPVETNYNRKRSVDSSNETDRSFILDVAQGNHSVEKVQFGEQINIVKRGNGKQTFREATVGGGVTVEAGELAFSATEGMTIGGAVSITGGTMSWSGGTLTITGQLSSSTGGGGTLSVAYGESTKLTLTGGIGDALSLTITGLTYDVANGAGWDLFGERWEDGWKSKITVNGSVVNEGQRYKLKIDDSTHHIVLGEQLAVQSLTWTSSSADDTLNWSGSSEWDGSQTFEDYDGVTLAGGSTGGKVQLSRDVIAGSLTVTGSNNAVVSLLGTGTLNVDGELQVGGGATLSVGGNVTLQFGSVSTSGSDGKLEVTEEGVIKPTAAATITSLNGAGGTIDLSSLSGEQEEDKTLTVTTLMFTSETTTTVSLGDSGVLSTSAQVNGSGADLIIDTGEQGSHSSGAIGLKMTGGGTLGSLQCKGLASGAWVTAELNGQWTLEKESNLGNLQMNNGTNLKLTLGADFTLNGFGAVGWGEGGTGLEIVADKDGVDFIYDCQFSNREIWFDTTSGSLKIGSGERAVDFVVNHTRDEGFTAFGVPTFALNGNLEIQRGILKFYSTSAGTIDGQLSGAGTLSLTNSTFTIGKDGSAGSIGTLDFRGAGSHPTSTVNLVGDLVVKSITSTTSESVAGQGIIQKAEGATAEKVYLLIDTGEEAAEETTEAFMGRYAAVQTFGENTGVGKAGRGELKLSAEEGAETMATPFKLAAGTLTWTGGTQKLGDFTAVSGTTLNVAGGNLQLGTFSGEITNLKLSGSGVLTAGVGVLTVGSIEVSGTDATLEIDAAGHAQIKLVSAGIFSSDGGILTIDVRNVSGAHYQLFDLGDSAPDWWTEWYEQYEQYVSIVAGDVSGVSLNEDGSIDIMPRDGVTWVGGGDNTWSNESDAEWRPNLQPDGQYVHFVKDTGGEKHEGTVRIEGAVTPHSVYIDGGTYTFVTAENEGGLNIAEGGMLQVSDGATLHLNLKNTSIPTVDLQGTLGLGHAEALPTDGTKLQFNGGALLYDTEGIDTDVSSLVDRENSTGHVRVQVEDAVGKVTWGSRDSAANSGIGLALDSGLDKSGTGNFTLAWKDDGKTEHGGKVTVEEGILTLDVAANSNAQLTGGVEVDGKGELALQVGSGSLSLSGDIGGDGKLSVSQGAVSLSGNNTIKQIELGNGTTTTISGNNALGGNDTTLILSGGTIAASSAAQVQAGKVTVNADTTLDGDITLTGNLEGSSSLTAAAGQSVSLSGDIAGYTGTLGTEEKSTWSLSGRAIGADGRLNVNLGGKGTFEVRGDSDVFLSSTLGGAGDSFTLKNGGSGELVITGGTEATGVSLDVGAGKIVLGDTEHAIDWKGQKISGEGEIVLSNVTLGEGGFTSRGYQSKLRVETAVASAAGQAGVVDLNGMDVSNGALSGIVVNERGQLKGVQGTITVGGNRGITVDIYLARENVGEGAMSAVVGSEGKGVTFDVKRRNSLKLHIGASAAGAIAESFQDTEQEGTGTAVLSVVENGSIGDSGSDVSSYFDVSEEAQAVLDVTGAQVKKDEQGRIIITGSAADVYIVRDEMTLEGDGTGVLAESKATLLSRETSKLHLLQEGKDGTDDDITIRNLVGVSGSELTVENQAGDAENNRFTVHFDNTKADITQEDVKGEGKAEDVEGQDTTFYGSLTAGVGVDVEKEGLGTFTVGGNYTLKDGSTTITQGRLVLKGEKNSMENLVFNYTGEPDPNGHQGDQPKAEERGLVLAGGGKTTIRGTITESTDETGGGSDAIEIEDDSELVLTGSNTLEHTSITADDAENGGGKLTIEGEGASLTLKGGDSQLSGVDVELKGEGSTLDVGDAKNDVASLSGNGVLKSAAGAELSVGGGSFSGTLDSSTGEAGKLVVEKDADFTLDNVVTGSDATKAWDVQVRDGGALTIDVSEKKSGESMTLGDVDLGSGNTTTFKVNSDTYGATTVQGNSLTWGEDSTILLEASAGETAWDPSKGELTLGSYGSIDGKVVDLDVQLRGDAFLMSDVTGVTEKDGKVVIELKETQDNKFERAIPGGEKNSMAGAQMFWGALKDKTQFETLIEVLSEPDSDYAKMVHGLVGLMDSGNKAELERALAAGAGSSISVLGPALVQDLHRQLGAIRNRTTTMANEVTYDSYDQLPMWHAWLNAEGNYHKMDSDGFAPGYTLNNWGGTVGADVDISPATTVGFALTAMYGDLKPDAADAATGDLDTTYLSAFARTTKGAWIHTFVVSVGMADVSLNRTVNAGGASYRTQGSTDGYAVGALYEVGYTKLMNRRGTVAFQPVFNVEIRHAAIKGYTETGSDAGLKVDDIEQDVVTFGFGARLQSIIGENIYNRTSILEGRLLVKADVGDNTGVAKNSLIGAPTVGEVESAEVGALGIEAGIGLTIPLGASAGSVFMDASAEVRSGWTSFNATVGYRINF